MEPSRTPSVAAALALLFAGMGCLGRSVEKRLRADVEQVRESVAQSSSRRPLLAVVREERLLNTLTNVRPRELNRPHLSSAILGMSSNHAGLAVFWVERSPSVTGVEMCVDKGPSLLLDVPDLYMIVNREAVEHSVVFRAVYSWGLEELPSILEARCSVRLISPGAVTRASPIYVHTPSGEDAAAWVKSMRARQVARSPGRAGDR